MKKYLVLTMGIFSFLGTGCTPLLAWMAAPEKIAEVPIDISQENTFSARIDFKTHTKHRDDYDKVGPYKIGIKDPRLADYNGETWKKINERKGFRNDGTIEHNNPDFTGRIVLRWTFENGKKQEIICDSSKGTIAGGIRIGGEWLPPHEDQEISEMTISVERVDSLVASLLKEPKLVIYRGGGK